MRVLPGVPHELSLGQQPIVDIVAVLAAAPRVELEGTPCDSLPAQAAATRALSSEGRMTAVMLTALPILAFCSLFLVNPQFYLEVSDDPAFVPGFAGLIVLYLIGFFTIRRMVDLKV